MGLKNNGPKAGKGHLRTNSKGKKVHFSGIHEVDDLKQSNKVIYFDSNDEMFCAEEQKNPASKSS